MGISRAKQSRWSVEWRGDEARRREVKGDEARGVNKIVSSYRICKINLCISKKSSSDDFKYEL